MYILSKTNPRNRNKKMPVMEPEPSKNLGSGISN
jgi:hypothetical protein